MPIKTQVSYNPNPSVQTNLNKRLKMKVFFQTKFILKIILKNFIIKYHPIKNFRLKDIKLLIY